MSSTNLIKQRELEMASKKADLAAAIRAKNNQQAREHLLRIQVALSKRPSLPNIYGDLPTTSTSAAIRF